jgi:uncharacterized membrane protein YqgA involved in biofilm formation
VLRSIHGTLLNAVTVLAGTAIGTLLGGRLPARIRGSLLDGLGLVTIVVGVGYAVASRNILIPLGCLVLGTLVGEWARIEDHLEHLGDRLRRRLGVTDVPRDPEVPEADALERAPAAPASPHRFTEGFLVASLVFCIGPLTVLGAFQNGLTGRIDQLALKSALDGVAALAFASTLGWGVGAAVVTVLVYQSALSLGAHALSGLLTDRMILELNALGGLFIMAIGLRLLELRRIRVANMLPGLLLVPVAVAIFV